MADGTKALPSTATIREAIKFAEDALRPLDIYMRSQRRGAEFRGLVWDAVGLVAGKYSAKCRPRKEPPA